MAAPSKRSWIAALLVFASLIGVFFLYTRPEFMVQMANQMWACF